MSNLPTAPAPVATAPVVTTDRSPRLVRLALAAAGLSLVAGTTACSGLGGGDDATSTSATTSGGTDAGSGTTAAARDASLDDRTAIASREGSFDDATVRFDVLSLRRSGALSILRFTATNTTPGTVDDTDKEWSIFSDLGATGSDYTVDGVYLVDPAHSKKYPPATDAAGDCVCSSTSGVDIVPTQTREFSATFAAPPADVSTVDVYVPGAGTFENVPVS